MGVSICFRISQPVWQRLVNVPAAACRPAHAGPRMRTPAAAAMHARRRHVRECRRPWDVGRTPCGATRGRRPPPAARPIGPGGPILFCPFHPLPVPCGGRQYHDQTALLEGYHMGQTESKSADNSARYAHARHIGGRRQSQTGGALGRRGFPCNTPTQDPSTDRRQHKRVLEYL